MACEKGLEASDAKAKCEAQVDEVATLETRLHLFQTLARVTEVEASTAKADCGRYMEMAYVGDPGALMVQIDTAGLSDYHVFSSSCFSWPLDSLLRPGRRVETPLIVRGANTGAGYAN